MKYINLRSALVSLSLVAAGVIAGGEAAFAYQTHMFNALGDLRAARAQLAMAVPDKGGHRVSAIGLVDQALAQTNAGIAAGAR